MECYLAIDIGASSGRHMAGWLEDGKISIKELYRFENKLEKRRGFLCWNIDRLYAHVIEGLKRCKDANMIPVSIGIDTWAVDFILLDKNGERLTEAVSYRDKRTLGMDVEVERLIPFTELYRRTGIQKLSFNTIYQLASLKKQEPALLERAHDFLMIPDYLHYCLTGKVSNEYTNASTTSLLDVYKKDWDYDLINTLGFPKYLFKPVMNAGFRLGPLSASVCAEIGFTSEVILPATHDTGSAFLAVPSADKALYLSSGTWSLLGIESPRPIITDEARESNFTNEGAYNGYRFLKNIMGLWMIQCVRNELDKRYSFSQLALMAQESECEALFDVNDERFLAPKSMIEAVQDICVKTKQSVPKSIGEIMHCIYKSLARSYFLGFEDIKRVTGQSFVAFNIVGGGAKDEYLNTLAAQETGLPVYAGPVEATVIGNLYAQMLSTGRASPAPLKFPRV